jgi:hypothetical protein
MSIGDKSTPQTNLEASFNKKINDQTSKEEEETLVLIQFTDLDDAQYCQHFSNEFKTINIEKTNPIIQIGNRFYTGEYTNNIGTYLFFEETQSNKSSVETSNSSSISNESNHSNQEKHNLNKSDKEEKSFSSLSSTASSYFGKTFKKLILTRLFIEERPNEVVPSI